ncbi:hypothetical protein B0H10DRAFT_1781554, partial [Mycena sp. CBHHK59/15]
QGVSKKPTLKRLARRGGVKRISGLVYKDCQGVLGVLMRDTMWYASKSSLTPCVDPSGIGKNYGHP